MPGHPIAETPSIAERLHQQRLRVQSACEAANRPRGAVRVLAVSKKHPPEAIEAAYGAGQRDFGENYVQELVAKAEALSHLAEIRWHLIGHLQSNKAKYIAPVVSSVQTVSSTKLALELDKRVRQRRQDGAQVEVLVEVNVSGEAAKSGCSPQELPYVVDGVQACTSLKLTGLMTVPPLTSDPAEARPHFETLAQLRDRLGGPAVLPELSMGMSADAEVAISCGATWVRLGTAIFGPRPPQ